MKKKNIMKKECIIPRPRIRANTTPKKPHLDQCKLYNRERTKAFRIGYDTISTLANVNPYPVNVLKKSFIVSEKTLKNVYKKAVFVCEIFNPDLFKIYHNENVNNDTYYYYSFELLREETDFLPDEHPEKFNAFYGIATQKAPKDAVKPYKIKHYLPLENFEISEEDAYNLYFNKALSGEKILAFAYSHNLHYRIARSFAKSIEKLGNDIGRQLLQRYVKPYDIEDVTSCAKMRIEEYVKNGGQVWIETQRYNGKHYATLHGYIKTSDKKAVSIYKYCFDKMRSEIFKQSTQVYYHLINCLDAQYDDNGKFTGYNFIGVKSDDREKMLSLCEKSIKDIWETFTLENGAFLDCLNDELKSVALLLIAGYTYREIGEKLGLSSTLSIARRVEKLRAIYHDTTKEEKADIVNHAFLQDCLSKGIRNASWRHYGTKAHKAIHPVYLENRSLLSASGVMYCPIAQ